MCILDTGLILKKKTSQSTLQGDWQSFCSAISLSADGQSIPPFDPLISTVRLRVAVPLTRGTFLEQPAPASHDHTVHCESCVEWTVPVDNRQYLFFSRKKGTTNITLQLTGQLLEDSHVGQSAKRVENNSDLI